MTAAAPSPAALSRLEAWYQDPELFVRDNFGVVPDAWQLEGLRALVNEPRIAMQACKGPGKSAFLSWAGLWFLGTRYDANILSTSITFPNHRDNLWKEAARWYGRSEYLQSVFSMNTERIEARARPRTWWWSARSWSQDQDAEQQANSLAGLHGDHVMVLLDEGGDYPEGVVAAAEGVFANQTEAKLLIAGNPTRVRGPFFRICTQDSGRERRVADARYYLIRINGDPEDPSRSPRISIENANALIRKWGRDSYIVRVNVLGMFPLKGSDQLFDPRDVEAAQQRKLADDGWTWAAKQLGIDPARHGENAAVIFARQGRVAFKPHEYRDIDSMDLAAQVSAIIHRWQPHLVTIDSGGIGGPIADRLLQLGHNIIQVDFGGKPLQPDRFFNKRAEMWHHMANWVKSGGCLPRHDDLARQLITMPVDWKEGLVKLPSKENLAKEGVPSPDHADALALTFAYPDPDVMYHHGGVHRMDTEYDHLDRADRRPVPWEV